MKLKPLSPFDMEQVRVWRNDQLPMLRTSFPLTTEMQEEFYHEVVCDRLANARFWGAWIKYDIVETEIGSGYTLKDTTKKTESCVGMCGLENIQLENRLAEISLILNPKYNTDDYLQQALALILREGFLHLNLENIYTEVYECSHIHKFWIESANQYKAKLAILPSRKYWDGKYYDSEYINFNKEAYLEHENIISQPTQTPN